MVSIFFNYYLFSIEILTNSFDFVWHRFPFDVKNLSGYLISFILQYIMISISLFFATLLTSLLIGSSVMLSGLTKDLRCEFDAVGECVKNREDRVRILKRFGGFIEFHAESKQLSKYFIQWLSYKIDLVYFQIGSSVFKCVPAECHSHRVVGDNWNCQFVVIAAN